MERRQSERKRVKANVYLFFQGQRIRRCRAVNLSSRGVLLDTGSLNIPRGTKLELVFVLDLGITTKLHRLRGVVARVGEGATGMRLYGSVLSRVPPSSQPAA